MSKIFRSAFIQFPGILTYCMSKAAMDQFTRCIALGKYTNVTACQVFCNQ